jgi:presequence protease
VSLVPAAREPLDVQVGDSLEGFVVQEIKPIPDYNVVAYRLVEPRLGTQVLHFDTEDTNNFIGIGFRTPPSDSTGVAHILEHTALCGSQKYPVRDPFFNMLKRSLSTFMNAFTGSDFTFYPFSTVNASDFKNLLSVYSDATFFPLLREVDFRQEGHRWEFAEPLNKDSPLQIKGVVYNEMKGAMSDPNDLFATELQMALFPATTYGHNSGGDPAAIPDLTHEQLKAFHANLYHPSNGYIFSYGDLPLGDKLAQLQRDALSHFQPLDVRAHSTIAEQPPFSSPRRLSSLCAIDPLAGPAEKQHKFAISWLLPSTVSEAAPQAALQLSFNLAVLSQLLTSGPASPMHEALLQSGLGGDYAPGTGYDAGGKQASMTLGVQGMQAGSAAEVESTIMSTLNQLATAASAIPSARVHALLHQIELSKRHVSGNMGMTLFMATLMPWLHGGNPVQALEISDYVQHFRQSFDEDPSFLPQLIQTHLLDNQSRVHFEMQASDLYEQQLKDAEQGRIDAATAALQEQDKLLLVAEAKALQDEQDTIQDVSILPTVTLQDVPSSGLYTPSHVEQGIEGMESYHRVETATNGVVYATWKMDISSLPLELKPYAPLWASLLGQCDAGSLSHQEVHEALETCCGGLHGNASVSISPFDGNSFSETLNISTYLLPSKCEQAFSLLNMILRETHFNAVVRTPLQQMLASSINGIAQSGHVYARAAAAAHQSPGAAASEQWSGLSYIRHLSQSAQPEGFEELLIKLSQITRCLTESSLPMRCMFVSDSDGLATADRALPLFLRELPPGGGGIFTEQSQYGGLSEENHPPLQYIDQGFPVSYVGQAFQGVAYTSPDFAPLQILCRLLANNYFHKEIREKGGAYGSAAVASSGLITFSSYRDPHEMRTLQTFEDSQQWLSQQSSSRSQRHLEEAKMGIFAALDAPQAPALRGARLFHDGIDAVIRDQHRARLFATEWDDVFRVAETYLFGPERRASSSVAIVGGKFTKFQAQVSNPSEWKHVA